MVFELSNVVSIRTVIRVSYRKHGAIVDMTLAITHTLLYLKRLSWRIVCRMPKKLGGLADISADKTCYFGHVG
jgi:hypothetical protein